MPALDVVRASRAGAARRARRPRWPAAVVDSSAAGSSSSRTSSSRSSSKSHLRSTCSSSLRTRGKRRQRSAQRQPPSQREPRKPIAAIRQLARLVCTPRAAVSQSTGGPQEKVLGIGVHVHFACRTRHKRACEVVACEARTLTTEICAYLPKLPRAKPRTSSRPQQSSAPIGRLEDHSRRAALRSARALARAF